MWICEKCGAIKGDQYEKCLVCSLAGDAPPNAPGATKPYKSPPIVDPDLPEPHVGMPRRFSIGTLMIITFFFALVFGFLKMCGVPPVVFIVVVAFILIVTACQALLYGGKNPRKASYVAGFVMYGLAVPIVATLQGEFRGADIADVIRGMLCTFFSAFFVGGPLGYAVGCLVAGIFLVRKEPDEAEPPPERLAEKGP